MATARMKLLRNRREAQVRQMRRDIAALLRDKQEDTARIRVSTRHHQLLLRFSFCALDILSSEILKWRLVYMDKIAV
jgi:hypothetical protein